MNYNDIIFFDFETTGKNPYTCQPIQFAAVCIDGRKLEIKEDSLINSFIAPIWDSDECKKIGLEEFSDEIVNLTGITEEQLRKAPRPELVWNQIVQYVHKWNPSKSKWKSLIKAGYNIVRYDNIILNRLAGGHYYFAKKQINHMVANGALSATKKDFKFKDPYGFGPFDEERGEDTLFHPRDMIELMQLVWGWSENSDDLQSYSFDAVREWLGIPKEGAHNAVKDVMDGANVLIRFMKLYRNFAPKVKFKGAFRND